MPQCVVTVRARLAAASSALRYKRNNTVPQYFHKQQSLPQQQGVVAAFVLYCLSVVALLPLQVLLKLLVMLLLLGVGAGVGEG